MSNYWITTTAGQRAVALDDGMPRSILLRDFNPYAVRAASALPAADGQSQQGNWSKQLPNGNRMTLIVEDSVLTTGCIFEEDVRSSLPYVEVVTQGKYHYDSVLIDDERILGVKVRIESFIYIFTSVSAVLNLHLFQSDQGEVPGVSSVDIHVLGYCPFRVTCRL